MSTSRSLHLNCAWSGENPVNRFGNHIWIFPRLGLILINSIGGKYLGINDWQISPQQFLQSQHPASIHAMQCNVLHFYYLPSICSLWTVFIEHILQHSRLEELFDLNLSYLKMRVRGTFLGLMVIWGITYLLDDQHSGWTVSEKSVWCWDSISNNEQTSALASSHNMWGKERIRKWNKKLKRKYPQTFSLFNSDELLNLNLCACITV